VDDVIIEFDAQIEQLLRDVYSIDIYFHVQDTDHMVYALVGRWNNQWHVGGGLSWMGRIEPWHEANPFPLKVGQWYHFKGVAQGDEFTLFIDDKKILTFNEGRITEGKVGFGGGGCKARFDNVVITGPNVPDAGPSGLAVDTAGKLTNTWGHIKQIR
jgi:hypothetical protein